MIKVLVVRWVKVRNWEKPKWYYSKLKDKRSEQELQFYFTSVLSDLYAYDDAVAG